VGYIPHIIAVSAGVTMFLFSPTIGGIVLTTSKSCCRDISKSSQHKPSRGVGAKRLTDCNSCAVGEWPIVQERSTSIPSDVENLIYQTIQRKTTSKKIAATAAVDRSAEPAKEDASVNLLMCNVCH